MSVTLSEEAGVRYLHFGTEWIQGAMRMRKPFDLELEYTQQMMAWWLFLDATRRDFQIGQLGLGAGSLTKFCWKHCLSATITTVEIDAEVIACAHSMFALPVDDSRLTIVQADAAAYLARPRVRGSFDVLQVDLYDAAARGPVYGDAAFYADCQRALREPGVLVVNLFGLHASFHRNISALDAVFGGRVIALPEIDAGNRVALAFKGPPIAQPYAALYERAAVIHAHAGLRAKRWVDGLKHAAVKPRTPGRSLLSADKPLFEV